MFSSINTCWVLVAAFLVYFMQAGFALCEAGFTRAKNTGNILMKNMMDFCIGTPCYWVIGFGLMFGGTSALIGGFDPFIQGDYGHLGLDIPLWVYIVFQTVFCATAATIVSGSMAERTNFKAYCVYSAAISLVVYPICGHWMWGGGWLQSMGFHDFAGSAAVHNVGGVIALLGAAMLGPRIGKYDKDGTPHAIPGHNLTAGALGVFILWFCWFGFNGGSSLSLATDEAMTLTGLVCFNTNLAAAVATCVTMIFTWLRYGKPDVSMTLTGLVCFNTNLAAAVATCVTMIFTWLRYGKPDVSMTLNGSLAGLVAITAGCDAVSPFGAFIIGFVAGILVVLSVEFFDKIAKIDDPVGAVSVHFANGVWGTIAVGLFSNGGDGVGKGLFYGGGFAQLGTQLLGLITVDVYVVVVMFIIFKIIDKTIGLRVPAEVEIDGLDIHEHGLTSAYAGFSISDANAAAMVPNENTDLGEDDASKASAVQMNAAVPVVKEPAVIHDGIYDTGMHKVSIIAKLSKFDQLKTALNDLGVTGMTVTQVMGCGIQKGTTEKYRGVPVDSTLLPKIKVEVIVSKISVDAVVDAAKKALYTGHIGDGKIFVYNVTRVVKIRTGEEDFAALQDVE
ncbi:adenylate cyclase [Faecalibacterium sp. BCRC 81149]|uniref:ammonium transporter n=1 Tax=Faecalibacterium sp. BCRC 81149 TaxID=2315463 RepID=UPI001FA73A99|nr:ammonium transporter [Faecalibacterium sp. BCRC 81149]MCI3216524.1 adenylate cyclase [Faecalibacterium sp. BCRC 81149]